MPAISGMHSKEWATESYLVPERSKISRVPKVRMKVAQVRKGFASMQPNSASKIAPDSLRLRLITATEWLASRKSSGNKLFIHVVIAC